MMIKNKADSKIVEQDFLIIQIFIWVGALCGALMIASYLIWR